MKPNKKYLFPALVVGFAILYFGAKQVPDAKPTEEQAEATVAHANCISSIDDYENESAARRDRSSCDALFPDAIK